MAGREAADAGSGSPAGGRRKGAELSAAAPPCRASPGKVTTPPQSPLAAPRPWSPARAERVGRPRLRDPQREERAAEGQWRRLALIGDICTRARGHCEAPNPPVPRHWPLGLTSWGLQTPGGRPQEGLSAWLQAAWGNCSCAEGRKPPMERNFWNRGTAAPLTMHTHLAPTPRCRTSVPRERWGQRGPSSGHRVSRGDRVAGGTAAQGAHRLPHCDFFAASAFASLVSRLSPPPHIPRLSLQTL